MKLLLIAFLLYAGTPDTEPASVESWLIKSNATKVYSLPSARSKVKFIFKAGTPVRVDEKQGRFYRVTGLNGKEGWVFRFRLIQSADAESRGNLFSEVSGGQKIASLETESQSSIRGRSGPDVGRGERSKLRKKIVTRYAEDQNLPKETVGKVFSLEFQRTSRGSVDRFLSEEQLGEFAGSQE